MTTTLNAASSLLSDQVFAGAPVFRLSPDKFAAMVRDGILTEDDPVEYLQGVLVQKMTKSDQHISVTWYLRRMIDRMLSGSFFTMTQDPIDLGDSEPEPDVMVVRGDPDAMPKVKPRGDKVALVIEVSDSTLRRDRELKRLIYAKAEIPVYWIVNLNNHSVEIYSNPRSGDYEAIEIVEMGSSPQIQVDGQSAGAIELGELFKGS